MPCGRTERAQGDSSLLGKRALTRKDLDKRISLFPCSLRSLWSMIPCFSFRDITRLKLCGLLLSRLHAFLVYNRRNSAGCRLDSIQLTEHRQIHSLVSQADALFWLSCCGCRIKSITRALYHVHSWKQRPSLTVWLLRRLYDVRVHGFVKTLLRWQCACWSCWH